jgi:tetratricopeptide (TPR) repeat protein
MVAPVPAFFNLYFMNYSYVADHFQYLGSIGLIALAAAGVTVVLRNRVGRMAVTMPALVVLGALSWHHCLVFQNEEVLWRDTIAKDPGCWMAHNNLGNVLLREGKPSDAIGHYEQALRIKPDNAKAHNDLGSALAQTGKIEEAIAHYQQALRIKPDFTQAQNALARVQARQ